MSDVTFTKLFSSITASTIWGEDDHTRLVWITMLAMSNKNGYVFGSVPGLATMARVPLESTVMALEKLQQPDKWSRTKEHEGRRIEVVDGGWRLLTYLKHRAIRDEEERREYMKEYMRQRRKPDLLTPVSNVNHRKPRKPKLAHTEAEAEAEADTESKEQPLPSFPPDFDKTKVETPEPGKIQSKHSAFKELIFRCYGYLNDGEKPPWDGSEAKQLSALIGAKPDLDSEKFHQWLGNYAASANIKPGARPREFLPHISDYATGALDRFGRPQDA